MKKFMTTSCSIALSRGVSVVSSRGLKRLWALCPKMNSRPNWHHIRGHAESIFALGEYSVHGPDHWRRVEANGLKLCRETGADETVVRLFALLHDSCRLDDGADLLHGPRAADMLGEIAESLFTLDSDRLELFEYAIRHHTGGQISNDPTIGTCWDADRLDLGRVGTIPSPRYMSTAAGRRRASKP
jgi:uncharacterized protein